MIAACIYFSIALLAVAIEAMFGFDLPVVLLITGFALAYSIGYLVFASARAHEHVKLARHVMFACLVSVVSVASAGAYVSYLRIQCTKNMAYNHFIGPMTAPCNRSEHFIIDRISYSAYTKMWYATLYGRTIGFYSEEDQTWEFAHDKFIKRALAAVR